MLWFVSAILILMGALPCLLLGYFIGVKKQMGLISGYDPEKVEDPDGLATWTGKICNTLGVLIALIAICIATFPEYGRAIALSVSFLIMIVCLIGLIGARHYLKKPDPKDLPF